MDRLSLLKGARKIVDVCAGVRPGEDVVIVTDFRSSLIAELIAGACIECDAEVVITAMAARSLDGEEPPPAVARAVASADVIFTPVYRSLTHSKALRRALENGARVISLSAFRPEMLISGGIDADFEALKPRADLVAAAFSAATEARLTSPAGTDLTIDTTDRPGNGHGGLAHKRGELATIPNVEASVAPVEGSANGRIVIDASIPYFELGLVHQPIYMDVKAGRIASIEGDDPIAAILSRMLADVGVPEAYNIAQLAIGLNPRCRVKGWMLEDEGAYGTAHIGIGTSTNLGGRVYAPLHFDALMWSPTLWLDGEQVMKGGEWLSWA